MVKIGRLIDHPTTAGSLDYGRAALDLVFDPINASGGIAGHVLTLVDADDVGSVERVIAGARRLASEGCLLILGPSVTDFAVPLIPVLDELQVPAINWSGSGLARGAWGFQLKVGSLPDEAGYLTRLIAARGYGEIALVRDGGPIGDEYAGYLRGGLDSLGIVVMTDLELSHADDAARCAEALRADEPPCVVYLGLGPKGVALCRAMRASGCTVPVIQHGIGASSRSPRWRASGAPPSGAAPRPPSRAASSSGGQPASGRLRCSSVSPPRTISRRLRWRRCVARRRPRRRVFAPASSRSAVCLPRWGHPEPPSASRRGIATGTRDR